MRTFFSRANQGLAWLAYLATTTTILISNRDVGGLLNLKVFLILKLSFYWSMVTKTARITLPSQGKGLTIYLSFDINSLLNSLLQIGDIPVPFVQLDLDWGSETFPKISDKQLIYWSNSSIECVSDSLQVLQVSRLIHNIPQLVLVNCIQLLPNVIHKNSGLSQALS